VFLEKKLITVCLCNFLAKNFDAKTAHKMMVKLTPEDPHTDESHISTIRQQWGSESLKKWVIGVK